MAGETKITLSIDGQKKISVSMENSKLDYTEFMELIEMLINNSGYSVHEIQSYVLDWAHDIKSSREN